MDDQGGKHNCVGSLLVWLCSRDNTYAGSKDGWTRLEWAAGYSPVLSMKHPVDNLSTNVSGEK